MVTPIKSRLCRHTRVNGARCRAIALKGHNLCHWHQDLNTRRDQLTPNLYKRLRNMPAMHTDPKVLLGDKLLQEYYGLKAIGTGEFKFPHIEDPDSIQLALSMVIDAL